MRTALLLYVLAVVVRTACMIVFPDPAYADSSYYVEVARSLASGHGLSVDFVWIFAEVGGTLPANPVLPVASNAHWLPLASFIQAPFVAIMGATAIASALPMVLIGSLAAPLTLAIARDVGASRHVQMGAAVMAAIPAAGTVFMAQPENFAIFQPLVAATLWLAARGLRGDVRAYALAGLLVGVASLARNDAFLLGGAVGLVFVIDRLRALRSGRAPALPAMAAVACFGLFLVVLGPWWARQLAEFGSISPTASNGQALWLTEYRQWNSTTATTTFAEFMAQGWATILNTRLIGLVGSLANYAVLISSIVLLPLIPIGAWARRRSDDFLPFFLFFAILLAGATIIFPLHVPGGAFIHTAVGLGPHSYILGLEAVAVVVGWVVARRPSWDPRVATPLFTWAVVVFVAGSAFLYAPVVWGSWDETRAPRQALAAELDRLDVPATDRLMTIDAGGFKYWTGRGGVVSPDDPIERIEAVARGYDIRWLVLERRAIVDALRPVLRDAERPRWIGAPAWTLPSDAEDGVPTLALYPVCTTPADQRCALAGIGD
ncbi:MAG: glycosyltransferase family 39 protein [Candidatus Limnocylindrales bacterium]